MTMWRVKNIASLLTIFALFCAQTQAASIITRGTYSAYASGFMKNQKVTSSYIGPGDVVSGATAWYGLRAYNGAYAAATSKAVSLRRASDNTTCDFNVATSGALGVSASGCSAGSGLSLASFATTDATCTGTAASSTTLTVTGCSSTPNVGSTITGTGFTQPVYATAVSVAAGSGTITMNTAQTVTAASSTLTYGLYVTSWYDQTGSGNTVSQATAGNQPELLSSCGNSLPCVVFISAKSTSLSFATFLSMAQPITVATVAQESITATANNRIFASSTGPTAGNGGGILRWNSSTVFAEYLFATLNISATVTASALESVIGVWNGTSSSLVINNSSFAAVAAATTSWNAGLTLGAGSNLYSDIYEMELGIWPAAFNSTQQTNICHNQYSYWGTSVSC